MKDSTVLLIAGAGIVGLIAIAMLYKNQTSANLQQPPVVVMQQPQRQYYGRSYYPRHRHWYH